jgi:hypothetical protein
MSSSARRPTFLLPATIIKSTHKPHTNRTHCVSSQDEMQRAQASSSSSQTAGADLAQGAGLITSARVD